MSPISFIKSLYPSRIEHWIMMSVLLYTISSVLQGFVSPFISKIFLYSGCGVYIYKLITKWKGIPLSGITRFAFVFLLLWTIALTIHMFLFFDLSTVISGKINRGFVSYVSFLLDSLPFFPHLLILCICCFKKGYEFDFRYFIRISLLMALIYIVMFPFAFKKMTSIDVRALGDIVNGVNESKDATMGLRILVPATILIYLNQYLSLKKWRLFLLVFICGLLINAYMGRRGATAFSVLYLLSMWLIYVIHKGSNRFLVFIIGVLMLGVAYMIFIKTSDSFFSYILERGMDDNRSDRNEDLIVDMTANGDWLCGRGWFGQYFDTIYGYRGSIETGALALLLRGGFLYLVPYVSILLFTFINGLFRSNNILCKSFGLLAGLQILYLYPYGWPMFSMDYLMLWVGVYFCNQPLFRSMSDDTIYIKYFA